MQVAPQIKDNSSLSGKVPTAQPSALNSLFNKTINVALRYTVKPIANCVVQGAAIALENSALWYMRQNEQYLTQFTGSPDLVEFIHAFSRQYPIFEGKEALQAQFFIHMMATFAKKEKSNWTGAELLLRFAEWFSDTYKVISERKSYSPAEFSDMASQVLEEIMPELNYCDFFGYLTSKMGTIFSQLHDAHLAAGVTSSKKVDIQKWLPSKPSNETIASLLSGALPSASASFIEEVVSVFTAPNQIVLNPFKDFFEDTKNRLLTYIFEKIERRDYAFLRPFALSTIEAWPDLLRVAAIDFIQEEKSIPLFLKGPLVHYLDQNASLLVLETYRIETVRAKRILSVIWPLIVKNPLVEDGHEAASRELIQPVIDYVIPQEAMRPAVIELALLELGRAYSHSGQKDFSLFLSSYKENILIQVTNLYNKRGFTVGDTKKLLDQIAPSFTILFPKGIKVAHEHLVKLIQFTRPLTKQDKIKLVEKSLGDRQKAVTRVNDLSFLLDFGISYIQEKSFTSHNVVAGTTAEPFFVALKEGILRLVFQASAHIDLPCALALLEEISELIKRKKVGESVGHIITAKIRALSPDFDPEEIEWLLTFSWPFIEDEAQFLFDLFKGTGIAQFAGAAPLFSKMVDKVQGLLVSSLGSLVTGSHFVSAFERTASLAKPFVEVILKRLLLNLLERGQKKRSSIYVNLPATIQRVCFICGRV